MHRSLWSDELILNYTGQRTAGYLKDQGTIWDQHI